MPLVTGGANSGCRDVCWEIRRNEQQHWFHSSLLDAAGDHGYEQCDPSFCDDSFVLWVSTTSSPLDLRCGIHPFGHYCHDGLCCLGWFLLFPSTGQHRQAPG